MRELKINRSTAGKLTALGFFCTMPLMLIACEDDSPAENAAEAVDEAADEVEDAAEDAADEIEDAVDGN